MKVKVLIGASITSNQLRDSQDAFKFAHDLANKKLERAYQIISETTGRKVTAKVSTRKVAQTA